MKLILNICFLAALSTSALKAQVDHFCGQATVTENILNGNPKLRQAYERFLLSTPSPQQHAYKTTAAPMYTIPMVFHILHQGGVENISDAQIIDQVAILNRDYQKQNADTNLVVPNFTNNIANVGIAFKLATIDPQGNCTNGIVRHYDAVTTAWPMPSNNFSAYAYTWPPDKYLNVYVVANIVGLNGAYTILPGTPVPTIADAIVIEHYVTGSIGTANVANSRVLTHEVGHWFNLLHIWGSGNSPGVSCGDDAVFDTPITKGFITCATSNAAICTPSVQENVQNYMDYAPCKIMFTNGQAARMISCLTGTVNNRQNLYSPSNLLATGITNSLSNCSPSIEIAVAPSKTVCLGKTVVINSYTSNATPTTFVWTANNGAVISNSSATSATVTFANSGNSTVTCLASNANGSSASSLVITAISNAVNVTSGFTESFETGNVPLNWNVINATSPSASWYNNNFAASHGVESMYVNGEVAPGASIEILETPSYNFLNNPGASYTFKYAYARKNNTHLDVFKVQASKDCGGSWTDIYVPSAASMANGSGGVTTSIFVPVATEWKSYDITLHPLFTPFLTESNVRMRFYFREDSAGFGNRFYLDEINFVTPTGINEHANNYSLQVFPNPARSAVNVSFVLSENRNVELEIVNALGQVVIKKDREERASGKHLVSINGMGELNAGIYFLKVDLEGIKLVKKIIVEE